MADNGKVRLNKFLAACGLGSRRASETLIRAGRVRINGRTVEDLATYVEPGKDRVTVDGNPAQLPEAHVYYLFHKPPGVVTTARDPEGRPTVLDFIPSRPRVFPVGRLDQDTSGVLLLTDDGNLSHHLLHPRYHVEKEYRVVVAGTLSAENAAALERGVSLEGEPRITAPAVFRITRREAGRTRLTVVLREGRKRQVRRMLETVGHSVIQLLRVRMGPLELGSLAEGSYRELTPQEVRALRRTVQEARGRARSRPRED